MLHHETPLSSATTPIADVTLEIREALATITIERPAKINAIRLLTWQTLRALVTAADSNPAVGLIVVRGSGPHFSAGNDIAALSALPGHPAEAQVFAAAWADAIQTIEDASKPVIMAIQGVCYGSALAMSLAGDVRIASASAVFSIPVAKLGALYLQSDLQRLVATIGMSQSKKLIYSSEILDAEQALRIGLVDEVFPQERFEVELQRLVQTILTRSPFSLLRSKAMLREISQEGSARETRESLAAFAEATQSDDFIEGISAFLSRRTARFR
jgi:enoyl-CoA hydratase/carnithine racemase